MCCVSQTLSSARMPTQSEPKTKALENETNLSARRASARNAAAECPPAKPVSHTVRRPPFSCACRSRRHHSDAEEQPHARSARHDKARDSLCERCRKKELPARRCRGVCPLLDGADEERELFRVQVQSPA